MSISGIGTYPFRYMQKRTIYIIKNRDYASARPEDYLYSTLMQITNQVTVDEHASFIDGAIENNPSEMIDFYVRLINSNPYNLWNDDVVAEIFNSTGISVDKCASMLNHSLMSSDKAATILNSTNISYSRVASILNDLDLEVSKAATILNSTNISVDKIAEVFNSSNIGLSRIKNILSDANITANRVQSILYTMVDKGYYDRLIELFTFDAITTICTN